MLTPELVNNALLLVKLSHLRRTVERQMEPVQHVAFWAAVRNHSSALVSTTGGDGNEGW